MLGGVQLSEIVCLTFSRYSAWYGLFLIHSISALDSHAISSFTRSSHLVARLFVLAPKSLVVSIAFVTHCTHLLKATVYGSSLSAYLATFSAQLANLDKRLVCIHALAHCVAPLATSVDHQLTIPAISEKNHTGSSTIVSCSASTDQ